MEDNEKIEKNKVWLWTLIILIVAVFLIFAIKSYSKESKTPLTQKEQIKISNIESLEIGENPDIGVDDFSGLQISQEEILP